MVSSQCSLFAVLSVCCIGGAAVSHMQNMDESPVHIGISAHGGIMKVRGRAHDISNATRVEKDMRIIHNPGLQSGTDHVQLLRTSKGNTMQGQALNRWHFTKPARFFRESPGRIYMTAKKVRHWKSGRRPQSRPAALSTIQGCSKWPMWASPPSVFKVKNISDLGLPHKRTQNLLNAGAVKGIL